MTVKRVPDNYMPNGVRFLIKWKNASADPVKLSEGKIHKDPPGISGNLLEGRIYQDSFVLRAKSGGVCIGLEQSKFSDAPELVMESGKFHFDNVSEGMKVYYTIDESDPRYSPTAKLYDGGDIKADSGTMVRAVVVQRGALPSEEAMDTVS